MNFCEIFGRGKKKQSEFLDDDDDSVPALDLSILFCFVLHCEIGIIVDVC